MLNKLNLTEATINALTSDLTEARKNPEINNQVAPRDNTESFEGGPNKLSNKASNIYLNKEPKDVGTVALKGKDYGKIISRDTKRNRVRSAEQALNRKNAGALDTAGTNDMLDYEEQPNERSRAYRASKGMITAEGLDKETNKRLTLTEATIKELYDQLERKENDVDGIMDGIIVVTDPNIDKEQYQELIDRAQEIISDTPEGEIPLDDSYIGQYLQLCPICGTTFIEDHILEPGSDCPICYQVPEAFTLLGQLQGNMDAIAEETDGKLVDEEDMQDDEGYSNLVDEESNSEEESDEDENTDTESEE